MNDVYCDRCLIVINITIFFHLKLKIELAIPASNDKKCERNVTRTKMNKSINIEDPWQMTRVTFVTDTDTGTTLKYEYHHYSVFTHETYSHAYSHSHSHATTTVSLSVTVSLSLSVTLSLTASVVLTQRWSPHQAQCRASINITHWHCR